MKTIYGLPVKREEVIDALNAAFAERNLDEDEYENRVNEALNAKSIEELEVVLFDFPSGIKIKLFPKNITKQENDFPPAAFSKTNFSRSVQHTEKDHFNAILGENKQLIQNLDQRHAVNFLTVMGSQKIDFRRSQFVGSQFRIDVTCTLGETVLDLRNQNLHGKHIDIFITGGLSEVKILIPRGGHIQKNAQMVLGEFSVKDKRKSFVGRINQLLGTAEPLEEEISFSIAVHGNFWLGEIKVIY